MSLKKIFTTLFALSFTFVYLVPLAFSVGATTQATPPDFPSCAQQVVDGDWVSTDSGTHHIPGQEQTIEGSDDVYYLEGGNFLQCLCTANGNGSETLWWRIDDRLTQDEVEKFIGEGWFFANGREWNLLDTQYLAKNGSYNCSEPTPTPTGTPTPTPSPTPSVTVTPTQTPTPTPHDDDDDESRCTGLSASPSEGTAPLTVRFTGSGFDKNGDIKEYEFDFGDASGFQPQIVTQKEAEAAHRYENNGEFTATVKVKDQAGIWRGGNDACRKTIEVNGQPQVLSATTPTSLPKTGASALISVLIASAGTTGTYLFRRFRLA